jgi:hypothetical protein
MIKQIKSTIGLASVVLGLVIASPQLIGAPPLPGAIFTTDSTCSGVNLNIYTSKGDVYIDGGPAHPGAASLPDGNYYVQATNPGGDVVLGTSIGSGNDTPFVVVGGEPQACYQLSAILIKASDSTPGYDTTPNPGGEYKVWVSTDPTFVNNSTKTDNFKVKEEVVVQTAEICVDKFYDLNVNGIKDPSEQSIVGWRFQIVADDNGFNTRFTAPLCMIVEAGLFHVFESNTIETDWIHTTPTLEDVTLLAGDHITVEFGNVCLGAGQALTLGFWSNKNGQSLETAADFTFLNGLNLVNANGSPKDFSGILAQNKDALNVWLLGANATNMAYMLSAQLATMELNVTHNSPKYGVHTDPNAYVYAPALLNPAFPPTAGLTTLGFIKVSDLMTAANNILLPPGNFTVAASTLRSYEEALKTALDKANNNLTFVQSEPCVHTFSE